MKTGMEWDAWYLELCQVVAKKSQCLSRKIGAILVKDKAVVSQGYNGPPRGVQTCDHRWHNDIELTALAGFDKLNSAEFTNKWLKDLEGVCPRYVKELGFKSGQGLEWCVAGHAERNALINAARSGIATKGLKMYMDCGFPCTPCLVEIINAGIDEIIVTKPVFYDASAEYLLKQSGLKWRVYEHLEDGHSTELNAIKISIEDVVKVLMEAGISGDKAEVMVKDLFER
jgi:dCMP deaminase